MRSEILEPVFSSQTCIHFREIQSTHSLYLQSGWEFFNEIWQYSDQSFKYNYFDTPKFTI